MPKGGEDGRLTNVGQEVRHVWDGQTEVRLWADLELVPQIDAVLSDDWESWLVADVEPCGAFLVSLLSCPL